MKRLALLLPLLALLVGVSTVFSCHAARSRNPGAAQSRSTDRIAQALNGATNVMLYASTPGVTRAKRQLTLMGLVEEDEKRRLLEILDRSRPDTWIYVSCRHYLQCDASWFGIYVHPSKPEIGFDWTDFDALSAEATDAHAVFVCTEPELVEWVKDFTAKTRDGQTSPDTNASAASEPHAESAEWRPTPEQTGRFRFDDKGKVVVAEVDAEGRVRLLENGPGSPPLRIRPATIRNRDLFVVEMDDIPDTGRHWTLALDFDAAKRAWIVVGEGETAADIVPEKPGYRTALFRRLDEPPSAPAP